MAHTNVDIDDALIAEAKQLAKCKTKKEVLNLALREFVRRRKVTKLLELRGKVVWLGSLDEIRGART